MNVENGAWRSYKVGELSPREILWLGHTPLLLRIIRTKILGKLFHPEDSERILEIGAGTCYTSYLVKSAPRNNSFVVGTDISAQALNGAQRLASVFPRKLDGLTCCDSTNLPFQSGFFDTILGVAVLHHLEQPLLGCREIARVLRRGGRYLGIEGSIPKTLRPFIGAITAARYRVEREGVREDMYDSETWHGMFRAAGMRAQITPLLAPSAYRALINTKPRPESYRPRYKLRYPYERLLASLPRQTANILTSRFLPTTITIDAIKPY